MTTGSTQDRESYRVWVFENQMAKRFLLLETGPGEPLRGKVATNKVNVSPGETGPQRVICTEKRRRRPGKGWGDFLTPQEGQGHICIQKVLKPDRVRQVDYQETFHSFICPLIHLFIHAANFLELCSKPGTVPAEC